MTLLKQQISGQGGVEANFVGLGNSPRAYSIPEGVLVATPLFGSFRVKIFFKDTITGGGVTPVSVTLGIFDHTGAQLPSQVVMVESPGVYYVDFVVSSYVSFTRFDFVWQYQLDSNSGIETKVESLYVIPQQIYSLYFSKIRSQVDKALKLRTPDMVGYADGAILLGLIGGLSEINLFPPLTNIVLEQWPPTMSQLLINSATIVMLYSQYLFSVDTDQSYNDQGFSLNVDHGQKISSFLSTLVAQVEKDLGRFKMNYFTASRVQVQLLPYYPLTLLLNAATPGSIFREIFTAM